MQQKNFRFGNATASYYFGAGFSQLKEVVDKKNSIILTDEHILTAHEKRLKGWKTIVIKAGESFKVQKTVDEIIGRLMDIEADRNTTLIGVGGGVITDLCGYVASIYMRGIRFGFVPTSLLALVDASIGGKNGIDVGAYKNMVGTIRQPSFIFHDLIFLNTLPEAEWSNGFAEIIKHASILDAPMFRELEKNNRRFYQNKKAEACRLIQRNALLKTKLVLKDEFEKGDRKLLNFGHTLGHAVETQYHLSHGQAISIGMGFASKLSARMRGFKDEDRLLALLQKYELPTEGAFDKEKIIQVLKMDKKKSGDHINFILLDRIGRAVIQPLSIREIYDFI